MSIASAISAAQSKVAAAYSACSDKGATMPASGSQNLSNLADTIASITTGEGGGGGGATNFVMGTFTTNSASGVQSVTIPYTGSGYPIAAIVFVTGGAYNSAVSAWYNSTQRYAIGQWTMHKSNTTTSPTYTTSGERNYGVTATIYKSSTSSATTYTRNSAMGTNTYSSSDASASNTACCRFKSSTTLSVYVASTSYGLMANIDYTYMIVYSE